MCSKNTVANRDMSRSMPVIEILADKMATKCLKYMGYAYVYGNKGWNPHPSNP